MVSKRRPSSTLSGKIPCCGKLLGVSRRVFESSQPHQSVLHLAMRKQVVSSRSSEKQWMHEFLVRRTGTSSLNPISPWSAGNSINSWKNNMRCLEEGGLATLVFHLHVLCTAGLHYPHGEMLHGARGTGGANTRPVCAHTFLVPGCSGCAWALLQYHCQAPRSLPSASAILPFHQTPMDHSSLPGASFRVSSSFFWSMVAKALRQSSTGTARRLFSPWIEMRFGRNGAGESLGT